MIKFFANLSNDIRQYLIITGNYWAFTLTDGALRMLVVLHFHELGYSPLAIAMLFLFYELFGVITNLVGGWLGARIGLNNTMNLGLALQILALGMLLAPAEWLTVIWVMAAQALSGIAKDLNKMSAKSAIKLLIPRGENETLFRWVAILTGSKNTLKGVGFFLGGGLLTLFGFFNAILYMLVGLAIVWALSLLLLKKDLGKAKYKPKFSEIFSKSREINLLSAARLFLFASRDVWFVVALPVFLSTQFQWNHWQTGGFLAFWVIAYGMVQAIAPKITGRKKSDLSINKPSQASHHDGRTAFIWALGLAVIPFLIALGMETDYTLPILITGLLVFGFVFAVNSSLHSYMIVSLADRDGVSLDVGFYYMANAMGRLLGTVLSGWVFQVYGLTACLIISGVFIGLSACFAALLNTGQAKT